MGINAENSQVGGDNSIAPRLRTGEVMPVSPEGKVPTRYYGEIVFVSAKAKNDKKYGNSHYTETQVQELEGIRVAKTYLQAALEQLNDFYTVSVGRDNLGNMTIGLSDPMLDFLDYGDMEADSLAE